MKPILTDKPFTVFSLEADRDYLLARLINFSGACFASRAGYFAQQACEKYLKALLIQEEKQYLKTHDLIVLSKYVGKFDPTFSEDDFLSKLKIFDDFREVGRYGGESTHDPNSQEGEKITTAGMYSWDNGYITIFDEIVSKMRRGLDFKKVGWSDSLQSILEDNKEDMLVSTWGLPIKLKDILTTGNDFIK